MRVFKFITTSITVLHLHVVVKLVISCIIPHTITQFFISSSTPLQNTKVCTNSKPFSNFILIFSIRKLLQMSRHQFAKIHWSMNTKVIKTVRIYQQNYIPIAFETNWLRAIVGLHISTGFAR